MSSALVQQQVALHHLLWHSNIQHCVIQLWHLLSHRIATCHFSFTILSEDSTAYILQRTHSKHKKGKFWAIYNRRLHKRRTLKATHLTTTPSVCADDHPTHMKWLYPPLHPMRSAHYLLYMKLTQPCHIHSVKPRGFSLFVSCCCFLWPHTFPLQLHGFFGCFSFLIQSMKYM